MVGGAMNGAIKWGIIPAHRVVIERILMGKSFDGTSPISNLLER